MLKSMPARFSTPSPSTVHRTASAKRRMGPSRIQAMAPQCVPIPLAPLTAPERTALVQSIVHREANPLQLQICDAPAIVDRVEKAAIAGGLRQLESEYRLAAEKLQRAADPSIQRLEATIRCGTLAGAAIGGSTALFAFSRLVGVGARDLANPRGLLLAMLGMAVGAGVAHPVTFLWANLAHVLKLL